MSTIVQQTSYIKHNKGGNVKKSALIGYCTVSIAIFLFGVYSLYAKPGDIIPCALFYIGTCSQGGCILSDTTYGGAGDCRIYNCNNGCNQWDDKGNCINWQLATLSCYIPSAGGGGAGSGGGNGGGAGGAGGVGNRPGAGMPGWLPSWDDLNSAGSK